MGHWSRDPSFPALIGLTTGFDTMRRYDTGYNQSVTTRSY